MGDIIVGAVLLGCAALALRAMWKNHKNGKCNGCGGDCGNCKGCH